MIDLLVVVLLALGVGFPELDEADDPIEGRRAHAQALLAATLAP